MSRVNPSLIGLRDVWPLTSTQVGFGRRSVYTLFGICALLALFTLASQIATDPKRFPVEHVDVFGTLDYAHRDSLMSSIEQHTELGFYGLDIDQLRQDIENNQWIDTARVSRKWPSRIAIDIQEHEPAARWNDDHLLSKRLVLFKPHQLVRESSHFQQWSEVFKPLPQVLGSLGRHAVLLDAYRDYDRQLSLLNLQMTLLEEDERLSQTLRLSNGVSIKLGREQQGLRMQRFLDVYERLAGEDVNRALRFDMRYESGFAVGGVTANGDS